MITAERMVQIAQTDTTFVRRGGDWVGKCLICGGPLRFDAETGEGGTIEHLVKRTLGGTNDLRNLSIAQLRCNGEKGRHWDSGKRRRGNPCQYSDIVTRLHAERARRWREPGLEEPA